MNSHEWPVAFFDDDYLRIYRAMISPEMTAGEVDFLEAALAPPERGEVLDVACGYGRHAIGLARRGYRVTGVDFNPQYLEAAARDAAGVGAPARWVRADMRALPFENEFDGAYSYFTSFGYFSDEENEGVLAGVARALRPGGRFLLDVINRDWILTHPQQRVWNPLGDGSLLMEETSLDLRRSLVLNRQIHVAPQSGAQITKEFTLRAYTCAELESLCARHGLVVREVWGGADRSGYTTESRRLILLAERGSAMADAGPLRARLGELARTRKARMAVEPPPEASDPGAAGLARTGGRLSTDTLALRPVSAPRREHDSAGAPPGFSAPAVGVEEFLPGGEWRDSPDFTGRPGAVYVHERLRSEIEKRKPHWGRIEAPPPHEPALTALATRGLEHALFLDLETCGLSSSTVFLAGTMHWNGEDFVLRQYFARHYGEEGPLLRALNESMAGFEHLVTFNGKTFDVPFLQGRAVVHGVRLALPPHHLDLLHAARRRWRGEFNDCRLKTLESRVCRRFRVGDVPGDEIPGLYHDYVKRGDPYRLVPVFHHNLLDVITMSDLLRALCRPARPEAAKARRGA